MSPTAVRRLLPFGALLLAACARQPCPCQAPTPKPCPVLPPQRTEEDAVDEARYEVARQDPGVDWSVVALHPNPYVRATALGRLHAIAGTLSATQLDRVVALLSDGTIVYGPDCVHLMSPKPGSPYEQGTEISRAACFSRATAVGKLAEDVLEEVAPDRVVSAMVAHLLQPTDVFVDRGLPMIDYARPKARLRLAAAKAGPVLVRSVVEALPHADPKQRDALLSALTAAPLGSGKGEAIDAVAALQGSDSKSTATTAAAAVLVLTDSPGSEPAGVEREPRRTALRVLSEALTRNSYTVLPLLIGIGPAAAPLLDTAVERMKKANDNPGWFDEGLQMVSLIGALGPRGRRATTAMFALGGLMAARDPEGTRSLGLAPILEALVTVGATPSEMTPFVLAHATSSLPVLLTGTRALLGVHATLAPSELDALEQNAASFCPESQRSHFRRPFDWPTPCGELRGEIGKLGAPAP